MLPPASLHTLPKELLAEITSYCSRKEIGVLRGTDKQTNADLDHESKFAAISVLYPLLSNDHCHEIAYTLSAYVSYLDKNLVNKNSKELQTWVDSENETLLKESNEILKKETKSIGCATEELAKLRVTFNEDEQCNSESKKQLCKDDWLTKRQRILETCSVIGTWAKFAVSVVGGKQALLSLEHLVRLFQVDKSENPLEISYEKQLIQNFHNTIDSQVKAGGIHHWEAIKECAVADMNKRQHLVCFTSSPDEVHPYLKQLESDLVAASKEKYMTPMKDAGCCVIL